MWCLRPFAFLFEKGAVLLVQEQRQGREVLFPIRLDEQVMQAPQAWASHPRRTRHIGNFTAWENAQAYQSAFERLLRDLKQDADS